MLSPWDAAEQSRCRVAKVGIAEVWLEAGSGSPRVLFSRLLSRLHSVLDPPTAASRLPFYSPRAEGCSRVCQIDELLRVRLICCVFATADREACLLPASARSTLQDRASASGLRFQGRYLPALCSSGSATKCASLEPSRSVFF